MRKWQTANSLDTTAIARRTILARDPWLAFSIERMAPKSIDECDGLGPRAPISL